MQMPFFLAAHLTATIAGEQADGYKPIYSIFIQIATIFYFALGLFFLSKLLKLFSFKTSSIIMVLIVASFGTNAFYYIIREAAMSHIYSFALITALMFFVKKYFIENQAKSFLIISFLLGLIILVRPVNGLVIFTFPFLASSQASLKKGFIAILKKPIHLFSGIFIFLLILAIQLIIYKISTASFFVDTYSQEFFNFLNPHLMDFLFSYKKGAFLYTPILLISLTGLYYFRKSSLYEFFSLLFFILLLFYILSSWWNWWYGGSFSSRVLVEFSAVFMILLAAAFECFRKKILKGIFIGIIAVFILVNQIQTYQYRYGIINYENMDKQLYWDNFLKIDK